MLPGFSSGNTDCTSTYQPPFHYHWFEFTKSNGGMSSNLGYVAKKMWNISAKPIQKSSLSTIFKASKNRQNLSPSHVQRKRAPPFRPSPRQKGYHKKKGISLSQR